MIMNLMRQTRRTVALTAMFVVAATCSDPIAPEVPLRVHRLSINPPSAAAASLGEIVEFSAQTLARNGDALATAELVWSSSDTSVLVSEGNGRFRARANGVAIVSVVVAGDANVPHQTAPVSVRQVATRIDLSRDSLTLHALGQTVALQGKAFDALGTELTGELAPEWTSETREIATVNQDGVVTALRDGDVMLTLRAGTFSRSVATRVRTSFEFGGCVSTTEAPAEMRCAAAPFSVRATR
jgi:hypothetical protein